MREPHHDTTVVKIDSSRSPRGAEGEKYLASGVRVSMRLWQDEPVGVKPPSERDYETIGFVISGKAELHIEGQVVRLEAGDSYVVPRGARHQYRVMDPFTAVEATSPPSHVHGRDESAAGRGRIEREMRDRFIHRVEARACLPAHVKAAEAAAAVMCALTDRVTAGEAHELLAALPHSLRPLFERCVAHRTGQPVARVDRAEFLDRVAGHLDVTPTHAESITASVFAALHDELPRKLVDDVAHQLPRDLQELWSSPTATAAVPRTATREGPKGYEEDEPRAVFDEIEQRAPLPPGTTGADAFSAVMCVLCERISGGQARDVHLSLPTSVRPLVERCTIHRGEPASVFDREELLRKVAAHVGVATAAAESITRVVFTAVKRLLPDKEVRDVASQLPAELVELWQSR